MAVRLLGEEKSDPAKSEENSNNIAYRQTIKLNRTTSAKAIFRTTSISGKHYVYESRFKG